MIFVLALGIIVEHLTERTKEGLASYLDGKAKSPKYAYWTAPVFAYVYSLLLLLLFHVEHFAYYAIISAAAAIAWFEISSLWRGKKREGTPLRTKAVEKELKDIQL